MPQGGVLDAEVRRSLDYLGGYPANWVLPREGVDADVAVVGAGHTGLSTAFALRRSGIGNIRIFDEAQPGRAGIWLNTARMRKLRTAKAVAGPELGVPALSFRAWHAARHGRDAFDALDHIPRPDWAAYLEWYREATGADVSFGTRVERIEPVGAHLRLTLAATGEASVARREVVVRKLVLATGVGRAPVVPDFFAERLPKAFWSHTSETVDFDAFKGKTVAVVGWGASAFDAAATALEAGARAVHLFCRRQRPALTAVNRSTRFPGFSANFHTLPDAYRWRHHLRFIRSGNLPPIDAVRRTTAFANFHIHLGAPWNDASVRDGKVEFVHDGTTFAFEHVFLGTGYRYDPQSQPLLAPFADRIALWGDRHTPPADEADDYVGSYPYLGDGYQLVEKVPGTAAFLGNIHCFNFAATVSFGGLIGDVPSLNLGIPRLAGAIGRDLLNEDLDRYLDRAAIEVPEAHLEEAAFEASLWRPDSGKRQAAAG